MFLHFLKFVNWKAILTRDTTWMNLEDTMLSEIRQPQEDKCCVIRLYEVSRAVKFTEIGSRMQFPGPGGGGNEKLLFTGYRCKMKNILEMDDGAGCTTM